MSARSISCPLADKRVRSLQISSRTPSDIAPENQRKIFERFERVSSASEASGGLGLGLFIAHQIVKAHGGQISLKSEIDQGSVFTVEFPLDQSAGI
jgi:two-component system sensor histidine kinase VicK